MRQRCPSRLPHRCPGRPGGLPRAGRGTRLDAPVGSLGAAVPGCQDCALGCDRCVACATS
eukprot:8283848-Alexandrium_andersonii.AAC.1